MVQEVCQHGRAEGKDVATEHVRVQKNLAQEWRDPRPGASQRTDYLTGDHRRKGVHEGDDAQEAPH